MNAGMCWERLIIGSIVRDLRSEPVGTPADVSSQDTSSQAVLCEFCMKLSPEAHRADVVREHCSSVGVCNEVRAAEDS